MPRLPSSLKLRHDLPSSDYGTAGKTASQAEARDQKSDVRSQRLETRRRSAPSLPKKSRPEAYLLNLCNPGHPPLKARSEKEWDETELIPPTFE